MFCPQCGTATEAHIKYCKACGFRLVDFGLRPTTTEALTPDEAKSQLHRLKGTLTLAGTLAASLLLWLITLCTLAISARSDGQEEVVSGIITFFLVLLGFGASGWSLVNLWRSGFFKTYKEQRVRAEAALLAQPIPLPQARFEQSVPLSSPPQASFELPTDTNRLVSRGEATSITEPTTRTLRPVAGEAGKAN